MVSTVSNLQFARLCFGFSLNVFGFWNGNSNRGMDMVLLFLGQQQLVLFTVLFSFMNDNYVYGCILGFRAVNKLLPPIFL